MNTKQIFDKHYKRLKNEGVLKSFIVGAAVGFGINFVLAILYWMLDFGSIFIGVAVGIVSGAVCGTLMYVFKYKTTDKAVASRVDRYGLEERMITMLELDSDSSYIAELQRRDAQKSLESLPAESIRYRISKPLTVVTSSILAFSIFATVLGVLAGIGKIPYGKDILSGNVDGTFEIVYAVSDGGRLRGEPTQKVKLGKSTTEVRAVAENGWMFVGWDDGEISPERREDNVTCGMVITAVFEKIDNFDADDDDSDAADDLPFGSVTEESGGGDSNQQGGETPKDDGQGQGGGKWQDRNQFIDGATYYRDYLEFYYQYATGIFDSDTEIPPEIIEFFEIYFSGI